MLCFSGSEICCLDTADLGGCQNILIEPNFARYLGLVLEARHDFELLPRIAKFELICGVILFFPEVARVGQIFIGDFVPKCNFLTKLN